MADRAGRAQREPDEEREPEGPVRLCALTRAERPIAELVRFVAAPDGTIVADPGAKLPGRGVWLTCNKIVVAEAVRRNPFARSLKRQVTVPADLAERLEQSLLGRVQGALALANKAGLVTAGFAQVEQAIGDGSLAALLHGSDAAPGGKEKLNRKLAARRGDAPPVPSLEPLTVEQMSLALGRSNVVHAGLKHGGASQKFLTEAGRYTRYRLGPVAEVGNEPESGGTANPSGVNGTTHE